ncbi:hypothetical protein [Nitratireductor pacificus]|uniref:hypothetical protein n=1 Tax=Nitratireductor pacificus TaxID=1231180 RepID=UPI00031D8032|nr:hypothetical protein [Nitratireductor pacificus]
MTTENKKDYTMSRRKGELTPARIDQLYPFQIALEPPLGRLVDKIQEFLKGRSVAPRTQGVIRCGPGREVVDCTLFCFADETDAIQFKAEFGGASFDPKQDRGKGLRKRFWDA